MGYEKGLLLAVVAQFCGVTLAIIGCGGILYGTRPGWMSGKMIGGIVIPFVIAYGLFGIGLFVLLSNYKDEAMCEKTYTWFVPLCLYLNATLLSIMVATSGGVKQSLFSPLFFAIPAMAVVFVPKSAVCYLNRSPIFWVTAVTLAGYLIVYLLQHSLPSLFSTSGVKPRWFYSMCECAILVGSVILTVYMSHKVPPLL